MERALSLYVRRRRDCPFHLSFVDSLCAHMEADLELLKLVLGLSGCHSDKQGTYTHTHTHTCYPAVLFPTEHASHGFKDGLVTDLLGHNSSAPFPLFQKG